MKDLTFVSRERMYLTDDDTHEILVLILSLPELRVFIEKQSYECKDFENFEVINQELESKHDLKPEDMFYEKLTFYYKEFEGCVMRFRWKDSLFVDVISPDGSYLVSAAEITPSEYTFDCIGLSIEKLIDKLSR